MNRLKRPFEIEPLPPTEHLNTGPHSKIGVTDLSIQLNLSKYFNSTNCEIN